MELREWPWSPSRIKERSATGKMGFRERLAEWVKRVLPLCHELNRSQRFYFFGLVFSGLSAFWCLTPFEGVFHSVVIAAFLFLMLGMVSDLLILYWAVWETAIGKGGLLLLYALATNMAYASASRIVNELVKFDSSGLTYTVNLVTILLAPAFILLAAYILFGAILVLGQLYLLLAVYAKPIRESECLKKWLTMPEEKFFGLTFVVRMVAYSVVLGGVFGIGNSLGPRYGTFIDNTARAFIYNFDSATYSRCKVAGGRVIKVNDEEIVVVTKTSAGYAFAPQKCAPML